MKRGFSSSSVSATEVTYARRIDLGGGVRGDGGVSYISFEFVVIMSEARAGMHWRWGIIYARSYIVSCNAARCHCSL